MMTVATMNNAIPPGDPNRIRIIGREQGFKGLAVHFTTIFDTGIQQECPCLQTAWTPGAKDLEALNAGGNIIVQLLATQHPPIAVYTGEPPEGATMPGLTYDADLIQRCVRKLGDHARLTTKRGLDARADLVRVILEEAGFKAEK
jgi:hypothetical protein